MKPDSPGSAYRLFSLLLLPLWLVHAIWHGRKHGLKQYFAMRACWGLKRASEQRTWVHASSVGEVEAISPLVQALLDQGQAILFTSFTASGYNTIRRNFDQRLQAGVIPLDFVWFCHRFFRLHRIKFCLLMETELWPELLYQAARKQIPIIQLNARLSHKSLDAPIAIRYLLRRTLGYIALHLTRNTGDHANLLQLGADPECIKIVGNLKSRPETHKPAARLIERDYLLLASSHEGEELSFLEHRPANLKGILVVVAPRHPPRSKAIQQQLRGLGLNLAVRSEAQEIKPETEVYLADTLGELKAFMAHARLVVMGGSFDQTGGHNLVEPASLGCAIITGPSDQNIQQDIALLGSGHGVIQASTMAQCWQYIAEWTSNPALAQAIGQQAQQALAHQPDVRALYLEALKPYLSDA